MKYLRIGLVGICALVAIAAVVWGGLAQLRAGRLAAQAQAAEASALKAAGAIVAERVKSDAAVKRLDGLQSELSRLRDSIKGLRVTSGATWTGERVTFDLPGSSPPAGQPAPPAFSPNQPAGGESFSQAGNRCTFSLSSAPPPAGQEPSPPASQTPIPAGGGLFFPPTMTIEPRGVEAVVEGEAGAQALVGHVDLWQVDPPPERMLGRSKFRADVSKYFLVEKPEPQFKASSMRGWGFGGHAAFGSSSIRLGAAISPRLRPIFRGQAFHEQVWVAGVEQEWGLQRGMYLGTVQMIRWGN